MLLNLAPDHLDRHGTLRGLPRGQAARSSPTRATTTSPSAPDDLGVEDLGGCARRVCFGAGPRPSSATAAARCGGTASCWSATRSSRLRGAHNRAQRDGRGGGRAGPRRSRADAVARGAAHVRRRRAPPRGGRRARRRHLRQRLQGDERRLDASWRWRAFDAPVHLILGGQAKGQDFGAAAPARSRERCACRVPHRRGDAGLLRDALAGTGVELDDCGDLGRAVAAARAAAPPGRGRAAVAGLRELRPVRATSRRAARASRRWSPGGRERRRAAKESGCAAPKPGARWPSAARARRPQGRARPQGGAAARVRHPADRDAVPAGLRGGDGLQRVVAPTRSCRASGDGTGTSCKYVIYGAIGLGGHARHRAPAASTRRSRLTGPLLAVVASPASSSSRSPASASSVNGARRWLGAGPLQFQPSEIAKLALVLYAAQLLAERPSRLRTLAELAPLRLVAGVRGAARGLPAGPRDRARASPSRPRRCSSRPGCRCAIWPIGGRVAVGLVVLYALSEPYRRRRLTSFLDPWAHAGDERLPGGAGADRARLGRPASAAGWAQSVQKIFYLPEAHTDFILAIIGEELGVVGVCGADLPLRPVRLRRAADRQAGQGRLRRAAGRRASPRWSSARRC